LAHDIPIKIANGLDKNAIQHTISTILYQSVKCVIILSGSLLPYRFVVISSLYDSYTPGHLLDLRSHLVAWADHLLLLRWCFNSYKQWYCLNMCW